jgi:hypothetical protein
VVKKGEIANLPSFHFYIKLAAINPEDAFSGQTVPIQISTNKLKIERIVKLSQEIYGSKKNHTQNGNGDKLSNDQQMHKKIK